jgi:hypothetical protein
VGSRSDTHAADSTAASTFYSLRRSRASFPSVLLEHHFPHLWHEERVTVRGFACIRATSDSGAKRSTRSLSQFRGCCILLTYLTKLACTHTHPEHVLAFSPHCVFRCKFTFTFTKSIQEFQLLSFPHVWFQDNLKLLTHGALVPGPAWQEPPGNVEGSRIQMGRDVYINANVSVHKAA